MAERRRHEGRSIRYAAPEAPSQYGFLCIENKTPKGRQEPAQRVFQFEVERHGGKYIIVRSIDEFMEAINNYLNGEL